MKMSLHLLPLAVLLCLASEVIGQSAIPVITDISAIDQKRIQEDIAIGTSLGVIQANDPDGTKITFSLSGPGFEYFEINPDTGNVTVKKSLDYEILPIGGLVNIIIRVEDEDQQTNEKNAVIQVEDVNDELPVFTVSSVTKISEDARVGTLVLPISVTDPDVVNSALSVTCIGTTELTIDACSKFEVISERTSNKYWEGRLELKAPLNYELRKGFTIQLSAFDGINRREDYLVIEVLDVNDAPPVTVQPEPVVINEENPIGAPIVVITSTDPDTEKRDIYFQLIGTNTQTFEIGPLNGIITNRVRLDYDSSPSQKDRPWDLIVKASEITGTAPDGRPILGSDQFTTSTITIKISMRDINDNAPTFNQPEYRVTIPENIAKGQNLPGLQMTVTDIDDTDNFNSFVLTTNAYTGVFGVIPTDDDRSSSPTLYVLDPSQIDYESNIKEYRVVVTAREDLTSERRSGNATVIITIRDVNDIDPTFNQDNYTTTVREDATGGTSVIDLNAFDPEEGSFGTAGIRYQLLGGNNPEHFSMDPTTGLITVKACATPGVPDCIDYERKNRYVLTVAARDDDGRGRTRSVQVIVNVVDVNDNQPKPEPSYLRYIYELNTVTVNPLIIEAVDPDTVGKPVTYRLEGEGSNLWKITMGPTGANITATRPILFTDAPDQQRGEDALWYHTFHRFRFTVISSDRDFNVASTVTIIVIDINNNAPRFTSPVYRHSMSETTSGDSFMLTVTATDLDAPTTGNGVIDFSIESGAVGKFVLEGTTQNPDDSFSVTIKTSAGATFSYDTQRTYLLVLQAKDRGTPRALTGTATLTVAILDVNDKIPQITPSSFTINVREDTTVGTSVHRVIADDPDINSDLVYSMVSTLGTMPNGNNAAVDYRSMFTIERATGIVRVNQSLNRDEVAFISNDLTVEDVAATNQIGSGALFIRITEYNDQDPYFNQSLYTIPVNEEIIRNSFIANLQCFDDDDNIVSYSLTQRSPIFPNFFSLLVGTGTMIVNDRIDFDEPARVERVVLTATCVDSGVPPRSATTSIIVNINNINDNNPVFDRATYVASTSEGVKGQREFLTSVTATDIDFGDYGQVFYMIADPDFEIDNRTGQIYIRQGVEYDREKNISKVVPVVVYDSPLTPSVRRSATAQVLISILDTNDNCPIYRRASYSNSVPESAAGGTNILDLEATDADSNEGGMVRYSIRPGSVSIPCQGLFTIINSNNVGQLVTLTSLKNRTGVCSFTVSATDNNGVLLPNTCVVNTTVTVEILESENNAPVWVKPPQRDWGISILESQYEGMLVYGSKAEDSNTGPNGVVNYYFIDNGQVVSRTDEFRINRITGVIRAEVEFDREQVNRYFLTLLARDSGSPSASSQTTLTVHILDVDDNDPIFRDGPLVLRPTFNENKNITVSELLGNCSFMATDADSQDNGHSRIYYELLTTGLEEYVQVDEENCRIYLKKQVDYEEFPTLEFDVRAFNKRNDDTVKRYKREVDPSILHVIINIVDANDNAPTFTQADYLSCAPDGVAFMESVLEVSATDKDLGDNTLLLYSFSTVNNNFDIGSRTGVIRNLISFQDRNVNQYNLNLRATDGVNTATARGHVFITEVANTVSVKVNRPLVIVENLQQQLIRTIVASSPQIHFACISSMRIHVDGDGEETLLATDVMLTAVSLSGGVYSVIPGAALVDILNGERFQANSVLAAMEVTRVSQTEAGGSISLEEDAVLAVLIIAILLIFMALLLLCVACYCIRRSKHRKKKKLVAQRNTIISVAPEAVETSFNPVYSTHASLAFENAEYSTLSKKAAPPPPQNLQPYHDEEPAHLMPLRNLPDEPVPVIETEVMSSPSPRSSPPSSQGSRHLHVEYETRIHTDAEETIDTVIVTEASEFGIEEDFTIHTSVEADPSPGYQPFIPDPEPYTADDDEDAFPDPVPPEFADEAGIEVEIREDMPRPSRDTPSPTSDLPTPRNDTPSPRQDSPRQDSPRQDSPRQDSPRQDSPRQGSPRQDSPRQDSPTQDSPRQDSQSPTEDFPSPRDTTPSPPLDLPPPSPHSGSSHSKPPSPPATPDPSHRASPTLSDRGDEGLVHL